MMDQTEVGFEWPISGDFKLRAPKFGLNIIGCSAKNRFAAERPEMRHILPLPESRRRLRFEGEDKMTVRF
jgi:hypothetical protein